MRFSILSHACLFVEHRGRSVLIDPWLRGSAYWRSWWNFPPVDRERADALRPDFIYLTHIHWDHFHGPSLRAFGRDTPVLIAFDRYDRMRRDLNTMGFHDVREIPHGGTFRLGDDFFLTPYLFSPLGDTAVVVESAATTILNANDCKIIGLPLKQLLDRHPRTDFALRSHSSANSRVLYQEIGAPPFSADDRDAYVRSFSNFMAAVNPRYAIPFASNHCHLHRETRDYNRWIVSPLEVRDYFAQYREEHRLATELVVMLPGSSWSDSGGFELVDTAPFERREEALARLAELNAPALVEAYRREDKIALQSDDADRYFTQLFRHSNALVRYLLRGGPVVIRAYSGDTASYWTIDVRRRIAAATTREVFDAADAQIDVPSAVLKHALRANMFGHVSISKRVRYRGTAAGLKRLKRFELLLCFEEAELVPVHRLFTYRAIRSFLPRWRELMLYAEVALLRFGRGVPFQEIEQRLLQRQARAR